MHADKFYGHRGVYLALLFQSCFVSLLIFYGAGRIGGRLFYPF